MIDDTLIHLDGLTELAARAAAAHQVGPEDEGLNYEKFGICTPDLLGIANRYVIQSIVQSQKAGRSLSDGMIFLFLAGFDLGYQARIEVETREVLNQDNPDGKEKA